MNPTVLRQLEDHVARARAELRAIHGRDTLEASRLHLAGRLLVEAHTILSDHLMPLDLVDVEPEVPEPEPTPEPVPVITAAPAPLPVPELAIPAIAPHPRRPRIAAPKPKVVGHHPDLTLLPAFEAALRRGGKTAKTAAAYARIVRQFYKQLDGREITEGLLAAHRTRTCKSSLVPLRAWFAFVGHPHHAEALTRINVSAWRRYGQETVSPG